MLNKLSVNSHNEWDPLEAIVVGTAHGVRVPPWDLMVKVNTYPSNRPFFERHAGQPFPEEMVAGAQEELDNLSHVLEDQGVTVHRPGPVDFSGVVTTPEFTSTCGYGNGIMPRDHLIVVGDTVIEAAHAWRSRACESQAYRGLLVQLTRAGVRWVQPPPPSCSQELYDNDYPMQSIEDRHRLAGEDRFATSEYEPVFDTADFFRCGKTIFAQRSQVTNLLGIQWLQNMLGPDYQVIRLQFHDPNPMHMDATLVPLRKGLVMTNPDRPCKEIDIFKGAGWEVVVGAQPMLPEDWPLPLSSRWLSMNLLVLSGGANGERGRVIVEAQEEPTQNLMRDLGFDVIPVPFRHVYSFGGSFHCVTCDLRREGELRDYGFSA